MVSPVLGPPACSREPGYLPGPRARQGPRTASPDQPRSPPPGPPRPPGPAPPSRSGATSCQALPGPTQPGRSPPARGPGSDFAPGPTRQGVEGAGQCLEETPAPWWAGTAALYLEQGALAFCQEVWGPSPHSSLGAGVPPLSLMCVRGPTPVFVCVGVGSPHHSEYLKGGSTPSSEGIPPLQTEGT